MIKIRAKGTYESLEITDEDVPDGEYFRFRREDGEIYWLNVEENQWVYGNPMEEEVYQEHTQTKTKGE